jgi:hypothetical protein
MGRACTTHGKYKNSFRILYFENLKGRDSFGRLGVDRRIILKWIVNQ